MVDLLNHPKFQAFDSAGLPLSGGKVYTYESGTTTLKTTYSDQDETSPNTNPVILDSRGEATIYLDGSGPYTIVLKDSDDNVIWTEDDITGMYNPSSLGTAAMVDTGTGATDVPQNSDLGTAAYKNTGTASGNVVALDATGLPAVDGSQLTGIMPSPALYGCKLSLAADTEHDINISAGYKTLKSGSGYKVFTVSAITKRLDAAWAAGTGAGGLPTGVGLVNSQWYYIFIIGKPDGTVDAGFDRHSQAANILIGATGYTYYGCIGAFKTDASSNIASYVHAGTHEDFAGATMIIEDQKAQNTAGGTFTAGALRTRDLNTVVTDNIPGSSLATNQITLKPGKYRIKWSAPAQTVNIHQSVLYNITASSIEKIGQNANANSDYGGNSISSGETVVLNSVATVFEVQHQCATTVGTYGFGFATNQRVEVYTQIICEAIALTLGDL